MSHDPYEGVPLANNSRRGKVLERIAESLMQDLYGGVASHPCGNLCCNGKKRNARHTSEFDFELLGQRFEIKTAKLKHTSQYGWCANWSDIKRDYFDVLILVLYCPEGLYLFRHDGTFGVSKQGVRDTIGIQCYAKAESITSATETMKSKMSHLFLSFISMAEVEKRFQDMMVPSATEIAYCGSVLAGMSSSKRGTLLEEMVRRWAGSHYSDDTRDATVTNCVNGRRRGLNNREYDFLLGTKRVEIKSTQLYWNIGNKCWSAYWSGVKSEKHDMLLLALYLPDKIQIYEHDGRYGMTTSGRQQRARGGVVCASSSRNECIEDAGETIEQKMRDMMVGTIHLE